jgi:hypothetical protein
MGFFGMLFWLAIFWFAFRHFRRRERWVLVGPTAYGPEVWHSRRWRRSARVVERQDAQARGDQQEYIDALETRVSELENRLDFTERLLAGRKE